MPQIKRDRQEMKNILKLKVRPEWDEIEKARMESLSYFQEHGISDENIHSLSMIISELIENSIKYGKFKQKGTKVFVVISVKKKVVTIEVINPIDKNGFSHLSNLDKRIQWIRGYQDPSEAYIKRIQEVSKKPLKDEESGIGLVRIAYEGKAVLDFFVSEDQNVNVSVVSNLD